MERRSRRTRFDGEQKRREGRALTLVAPSRTCRPQARYPSFVGDDDSATVVERPVGPTPTSLASLTSSGSRSGASDVGMPHLARPEMVLHSAEREQSRRMAVTGMIFSVVGVASSPWLGGDPRAKSIAFVSLVLAALNNLALWYASASPRRYDERRVLAYFVVAAVLNVGIVYFLGVFGPVLVMFVLNVYTTCLGYSRRIAFVTLVGSIVPYVLVAVPITAGWLSDPGLMTGTAHLGTLGRAIVVACFVGFLCLVYTQARGSRETMVASLVERDEAVRRASHREALFLEARQDLERALHAGGLGRFTDQTLGSFKLGAVLARGGMGEVYEAVHVATGGAAAVKLLLPEVLAQPSFVRRFLREVRIAASLDSPHVVRVLEVGDESAPLPYLAMERLDGEDLAQILRREERLSHDRVIELVRQVGRGLEAAAAAGIVHRDVKPQNIFLAEGEPRVWKILDFGVSKATEHGGTLTEGLVVGTPQYMAPEQARGADVGPAADLYALGAIVYRALTGHPPFAGKEIRDTLVAVMTKMPARPGALVKLPPEVDLVLAIAMAKEPHARFATTGELGGALEAALAGKIDPVVTRRAVALLDQMPWREPGRRPSPRSS
jgi:eukaryotic-like serine/threonine-protein kinase